jgi:heme/copper-type cytochrome/quinol oxidase subunit 1
MTTIDPHLATAGTTGDRADGALSSLAAWITTSDHKKIGRLYIGASMLLLLAVAVVASLLGIERIDATSDLLDSGAMPQMFSLYRVVLTFGVVAPLGLGLAVAVVPLQLGARSLAFPRLALGGFWAWLVGGILVIISIALNGGPGGGDPEMVDLFLIAHILLVLGLIATAGSVATSVLTTRAPGMNMRRVPLFAWGALIGALGMLLLLPVLVATLVMVAIDHYYGRTTFGGNTGIADWVGFAFTQPATFVYAVPVFGFAAEAVATASRNRLPMRGVALTGIALVGTGLLAGVTQTDAALPRDVLQQSVGDFIQDVLPYLLLEALPLLGPVVLLAVIGLALKPPVRPRISAAFVAGILSAGMVFTGMAGNALYQVGDAQLAGTVFEEGAWLYVSYGLVIAALGALTYWGPKLWGRRIDDKKSLPLVGLAFIATVLAALPYYIAGFAKQPAGATQFDYSGPQNLWNALSAAGHILMLLTVLAFIGLAVSSFRTGDLAGDDPVDGQTLEWATTSPPPADNFAEVFIISSPEPLLDLKPARTAVTEGTA